MRCKGARVSTGTNRNLGCGEWDYSCNTYIEDPTRTDSLNATTNEYVIDGFSGTTYNFKTAAINNYYRNTNITTTVNSSSNLDSAQVGIGTIPSTQGIPGVLGSVPARTQHLFTAQELTNAGLSAGSIWGINIDAVNALTVSDLRVNIKSTTNDSMDAIHMELDAFTNVFSSNYDFITGENRIQFSAPFIWDGLSNLLIEFTSSKTISFQQLLVNSTLQDTTRSTAAVDKS